MYVGITGNYYNRFCEYFSKMFYGNYWLYDFNEIRETLKTGLLIKEPKYKAVNDASFNKKLFTCYDRFSKLAFDNMQEYRFFFAPIDCEQKQKMIESEMITELRKNQVIKPILENQRCGKAGQIEIEHFLPESVIIVGLNA